MLKLILAFIVIYIIYRVLKGLFIPKKRQDNSYQQSYQQRRGAQDAQDNVYIAGDLVPCSVCETYEAVEDMCIVGSKYVCSSCMKKAENLRKYGHT